MSILIKSFWRGVAKSNVRATATKGVRKEEVGGGGQNVSVVDRLPKKLNFYESTMATSRRSN